METRLDIFLLHNPNKELEVWKLQLLYILHGSSSNNTLRPETSGWDMSFSLDPSKQSQEVLFFHKTSKANQLNLIFNGNTVQSSPNPKHFGLLLDEKLTFNDHITSKLSTVNKSTNPLQKLFHYVLGDSLVTMCKPFIRPHLDYADVMFDKPNNATFSNRIEQRAQYNSALAITGIIRVTSKVTAILRTRI